jgi:hypothetical protein
MTPTIHNTKIANLTVNGLRTDITGSFAYVKRVERQYKQNGYKTHVGYARHAKGICYCQNCLAMVDKPYTYMYNGSEYWKCVCTKINYI